MKAGIRVVVAEEDRGVEEEEEEEDRSGREAPRAPGAGGLLRAITFGA